MSKTIHHQGLKSYFGDEDHLTISQSRSFSSLVFELLSEKPPKDKELKLFELILNLSIDHGPQTPSAIKTIEEAQKGESISESVSEGIEQIGDTHGGAAKPLMELLYKLKDGESAVEGIVQKYISEGKKIPGFGHRLYKDSDPRAELIFEYLKQLENGQQWIDLVWAIQSELNKQAGKHLPVNIDGAIAASFTAFGWDPKLGIATFIIARTPGLCAHYLNTIKSP